MKIQLETIYPLLGGDSMPSPPSHATFAVKTVPSARVLSVFQNGDWGMIAFETDGEYSATETREFYLVTDGVSFTEPPKQRLEFHGQFLWRGFFMFVYEVKPY